MSIIRRIEDINAWTHRFTKAQIEALDDYITTAGIVGPQGIEGPQGPQGIQGESGVSGITFKGNWVTGDYVLHDVVRSVSGAGSGNAYYCKAGLTSIVDPGTLVYPDDNWALFVMKGATGPQGPQGIQGIQGIPGGSAVKTTGIIHPQLLVHPILTYDINFVTSIDAGYFVYLPVLTQNDVGKEIIVMYSDIGFGTGFSVYGQSNNYIYSNIFNSTPSYFSIGINEAYKFIYIGQIYGHSGVYWKTEKIIGA